MSFTAETFTLLNPPQQGSLPLHSTGQGARRKNDYNSEFGMRNAEIITEVRKQNTDNRNRKEIATKYFRGYYSRWIFFSNQKGLL